MDGNADFVPDIFAMFHNGTRGLWEFRALPDGVRKAGGRPQVSWIEWASGVATEYGVGGVAKTSAAFVDVDGDCLPGLVVPTACGIEVWSNPNQWREGVARVLRDGRLGRCWAAEIYWGGCVFE